MHVHDLKVGVDQGRGKRHIEGLIQKIEFPKGIPCGATEELIEECPPLRGCEKIKGQVNNKSGFYGHEGTKARRFHEG